MAGRVKPEVVAPEQMNRAGLRMLPLADDLPGAAAVDLQPGVLLDTLKPGEYFDPLLLQPFAIPAFTHTAQNEAATNRAKQRA